MTPTSPPLLMIPGPTPLSDAVRDALAEPVRSHTSAENAATLRRIQRVVRGCTGGASARVHCFGGAGTLAMESALVNLVRPGERVVVVSHGYFGDRFAEIAQAHGMLASRVAAEWGEHVDPAAVARACVEEPPPAAVTVTHVDTSTGVTADVAALCRSAGSGRIPVIVDGVCATAGMEEEMDAWGAAVVLTGAQKALGVPPGLAILAVSAAADERRASLERVPAYYADWRRWDPVVDDPTRYFSTHATGLLRALEASCEAIVAEGLPARFERHRRLAAALRRGFAELGFEPLTGAAHLAPTLSVLAVPGGVDAGELRAAMAARGVVVAPALGPWSGRALRIGHMGAIGPVEVERTVRAAAEALGATPEAAISALEGA